MDVFNFISLLTIEQYPLMTYKFTELTILGGFSVLKICSILLFPSRLFWFFSNADYNIILFNINLTLATNSYPEFYRKDLHYTMSKIFIFFFFVCINLQFKDQRPFRQHWQKDSQHKTLICLHHSKDSHSWNGNLLRMVLSHSFMEVLCLGFTVCMFGKTDMFELTRP